MATQEAESRIRFIPYTRRLSSVVRIRTAPSMADTVAVEFISATNGVRLKPHAADDVYRFIVELLEEFNGETVGREPPAG